eukprot:COSAG02_NODE_899_length_16096_cov_19.762956_2_plen_85_part_00
MLGMSSSDDDSSDDEKTAQETQKGKFWEGSSDVRAVIEPGSGGVGRWGEGVESFVFFFLNGVPAPLPLRVAVWREGFRGGSREG